MTTAPTGEQFNVAAAQVEAAYAKFYQAKYPGENAPDQTFKYFDPGDDIPDRGIMFLDPGESFWLTPRQDLGPRRLAALFRTASRKPKRAGWFMALGGGWIFVADQPDNATLMFDRLIKQLRQ